MSFYSSVSYRMNEIMKVLTIIATIFIPLSFVVGLYGMNFEFMPELKWKYGYFVVVGLCFSLVSGMLIFFKTKEVVLKVEQKEKRPARERAFLVSRHGSYQSIPTSMRIN